MTSPQIDSPIGRKVKIAIERDYLLALFSYDAETGIITYRVKRGRRAAGQIGGTFDKDGYRILTVNGVKFRAARLIWFLVSGEWPPDEIDHRNRDRSDDRFCNLRLATRSENAANRPARGCSYTRGKWRSQIKKNGSVIYLGSFANEDLATAKAHQEKTAAFGDFASS